jgi:hypothetical protein
LGNELVAKDLSSDLPLLAATGYFFIFPELFVTHSPLDLHIVGLFSHLPLCPGLFGWVKKPVQRELATKIATPIGISLAAFPVLVDVYLVFLLLRSATPGTS